MIGMTLDELICDQVFFDVSRYMGKGRNQVYLKIEGLNPAGSIKLKTARFLLDEVLRRRDGPLSGVIESSSGNLGIALAMLCAAWGVRFECVVDANTLPEKIDVIRYFGAEVTVISQRDANGGWRAASSI